MFCVHKKKESRSLRPSNGNAPVSARVAQVFILTERAPPPGWQSRIRGVPLFRRARGPCSAAVARGGGGQRLVGKGHSAAVRGASFDLGFGVTGLSVVLAACGAGTRRARFGPGSMGLVRASLSGVVAVAAAREQFHVNKGPRVAWPRALFSDRTRRVVNRCTAGRF